MLRDLWCCGGKRKARRVSLVLPKDDGPYSQLDPPDPQPMSATVKCGICSAAIVLLSGVRRRAAPRRAVATRAAGGDGGWSAGWGVKGGG